MLIRALIVLLLVLNLGVAAWWLTRAPPPPAPVTPASTVPQLQLVAAGVTGPAVSGASVARAPIASSTTPELCVSLGPFTSAEAAAKARQRVLPLSGRVRIREMAAGPYRGWKVWLPPYPSAEAVQVVSERVAAAGFSDRFVVREGRDANSLALGRFGSEAPARQHAAALVAAGFPARAEPIGSGGVEHWLDVAAHPDNAPEMRRRAAALEASEMDCATWQ